MCGISGYVGARPPSDARAAQCLAKMRHRGPDGSGMWREMHATDWHICLLHTRLSIIDLDIRAGQPMTRSQAALIFNGEIYNYLELREGLAREGEIFTTESDTEVLLAGLIRHGGRWLDRVEGMWAFGFYENKTGTLQLSRDRFGEKPLFFWRHHDGVYFGSEIKFLAALAGEWPRINLNHVRRFLVNGYKSLHKTDEMFFEGVAEVKPANTLVIAPHKAAEVKPYWTLATTQNPDMSREEAVSGVRERMIASVQLRLRADVPMAFCMSGGVDSNSLISIAKRVFGYDVHGFTVMNVDARYEEQSQIRAVIDELGLRHTAMPLSRDGFLANLARLTIEHDAPVYTISYYAHWRLMELIAQSDYKIAVSGTAADELFTGYFDHHNAYFAEVADDASLFARSVANWRRHVEPVVRNPHLKKADLFVEAPSFRDHIYLDADYFSRNLVTPWSEAFEERSYASGLLRNRMLNELFHESVPAILHEDDLNAMHHSIENRSPFLDRSLVEFANTIPTRHLVHDGFAKSILRDSMRGIVPEAVIDNHRKVGFNAPIEDLLSTNDPDCRSIILEDSPLFDVVKREAVQDLLAERELPNSQSKFLFNCLSIKYFLEAHLS